MAVVLVEDDAAVDATLSTVELLLTVVVLVVVGMGSSNPLSSIVSFWEVGPPLNLNSKFHAIKCI